MSCEKEFDVDVVLVAAGSERELTLSVATHASVADLIEVLGPAHARAESASVTIDGVRFEGAVAIAETGLCHGSEVIIDPAMGADSSTTARVTPATTPMVAVVGGPDSGRWLTLSSAIVVGSGPDVDLRIDDATVSSVHVRIEPAGFGLARWVDLGSHNGIRADGQPVHGSAIVPWASIVAIGATDLTIRSPVADAAPCGTAPSGAKATRSFNRPPRDRPPEAVAEVWVPDAPDERRRGVAFDAAALVGPLIVGAVMVVVFGSLRYGAFALMGPLLFGITQISQRRRHAKDTRTSTRRFRGQVIEFRARLELAATGERERLEATVPDPAVIVARSTGSSIRLWERRPGQSDDLLLRLGRGTRPWPVPVDGARVGAHRDLEEAVLHHASIPRCPVEVDLGTHRVVGIVGDRPQSLALARSLVLQAAVLHGPADLGLDISTSVHHAAAWRWAGWLPHARQVGQVTPRIFVERTKGANPRSDSTGSGTGSRRLTVVDGPEMLAGSGSPLRGLLSEPDQVAIVLADRRNQLPAVCSVVVSVDDLGDATVAWPASNRTLGSVSIAGISQSTATDAARSLARFEDPEIADDQAELPVRVSLLDLLGGASQDGAAIGSQWQRADESLCTPIGVGTDGPVAIDLCRDGPHMLVGGTTGSGKSELLRSLIAGLAARHDPDHVVFVLIDYKGGSAFDACARLPHVVGVVTDLDDRQARRALQSFEAEIRLREERLRSVGAADLLAYRRAGSPHGPLPRLVVVVDEFATMVAELADFVGALVAIAQRGRSLGVHLVLATQRPSGVVSPEIRANTNLRIALRVQDPGDSMDVIDRRDAAAIDRQVPGRAFVRVGPSDVAAVQTALATVTRPDADRPQITARTRRWCFGDDHSAIADSVAEGSDLSRIVDHCIEAHRRSGIPSPRRPWLDPLPAVITRDTLQVALDPAPPGPDTVWLGLADDPDRQARQVAGWVPADGHLGVFGAAGSGTSTCVVTAAVSAMGATAVDDLWVYGFDHGGGSLAALTALPHVGAIVGAGEGERRARLIGQLSDLLSERRNPPARSRPARVLVLIDQLPALLAEVDQDLDLSAALRRVLLDGAAFGISAVVSAERPAAVPSAILGALTHRILLRPADPMDAATFGLRSRDLPEFTPGRGIDVATGLVIQLLRTDVADVAALADQWRESERPCPPIEVMPAEVGLRSLPEAVRHGHRVHLPIGPGDPDLSVRLVHLGAGDHLFVGGPAGGGVSTTLRTTVRQFRQAEPDRIIVLVAPPPSPLHRESALADAAGSIDQLADVLGHAESDRGHLWTIVIDDADRIDDAAALERLVRSAHCRLVVGARSDRLHGVFGHWTRGVRMGGVGLLLTPRLDLDGDLLGVRLPRTTSTPLCPGRGYLIDRGVVTMVQAAQPEDLEDIEI